MRSYWLTLKFLRGKRGVGKEKTSAAERSSLNSKGTLNQRKVELTHETLSHGKENVIDKGWVPATWKEQTSREERSAHENERNRSDYM